MQQIFNDSRYSKWYLAICSRAERDQSPDRYTEVHHIIPRFAGGDDALENLVRLTGREHFIAHWLLTKICLRPEHVRAAWNAFFLMHFPRSKRRHTSRTYHLAKSAMSNNKRLMVGDKNHFYGKSHSDEAKIKMSENWNRDIKRRFDSRRHSFVHKDGLIFEGTQYDFYTTYGLCKKGVGAMINGKTKSHKGWRLNIGG